MTLSRAASTHCGRPAGRARPGEGEQVKNRKRTRLIVLCVAAGAALLVASSALAWTVTMTAQTSLKRTYSWKIEKSVSQEAVTLKAGETANVTYAVTVTPTGSVDSNWAVSGRVTDAGGTVQPSPRSSRR